MLFDAWLGWLFQFLVQLYLYWMVLLTPLRNSSSVALSFPKTSTNRWASKHGQATFGVDRALVHVLFRLGKLSSIFGF